MSENTYKEESDIQSTRVARLLRERELRRSNRVPSLTAGSDGNRGIESSDQDLLHRAPNVELNVEEGAVAPNEELENPDRRPIRHRVLVVANRLPVSAVRESEDSWLLDTSAGGLVSALLGVKEYEATWIGWAGVNVLDEVGQKALTTALAEKRCIPVFLDEETIHLYYSGYCNNILWPLFHYLGLPLEDSLETNRSFQSQFAAYKKANQMFADVVKAHYEEGDIIWCHDYHLMYLPKLLKDHDSQMKVGWFLHTPFPSSEIHRTLPSRSELLRAVLAADLVGFHTYDYARHFVSSCGRILGLEVSPDGVEDQGRLTRVSAFPIGINPKRFIDALEDPKVQDKIEESKRQYDGKKVILGVDRLDMIKGIPQKILAFEKFLEESPEWADKVVLIQIAIPTRTEVPQYKKLKSQVHEIVGRINGKFGSLKAQPLNYLDRTLDFHDLCALYAITDVAIVTSLRDGMNLVSYEFVACQDSSKGVLILSEFAGAAQSLGAGAILVNPWNISEVAAAIRQALSLPAEEREKRHKHNFKHVTTHTAQEWADFYLSELNDTVIEAQQRIRKVPPQLLICDAVKVYLQSTNRLLVLGFNSVLTEPTDVAERRGGDQIKELELKVRPELKQVLKLLCRDADRTVLVLSGSERGVLDENFGEYNMWLAAENGMFLRSPEGQWRTTMLFHLKMDWVDSVYGVFEYFTERTPRSHFEQRETSLVWNYKYADVEFGRLQARDMLQHLQHLRTGPISNTSFDVVQGSHSVEVRAVGVTKGAAIDRILGEIVRSKAKWTPIDYVLCIGHFLGMDEDIYKFFEPELPPVPVSPSRKNASKRRSTPEPYQGMGRSSSSKSSPKELLFTRVLDLKKEHYFSCAVGRTHTRARYMLNSSDDVVAILKKMAEASSPSS